MRSWWEDDWFCCGEVGEIMGQKKLLIVEWTVVWVTEVIITSGSLELQTVLNIQNSRE